MLQDTHGLQSAWFTLWERGARIRFKDEDTDSQEGQAMCSRVISFKTETPAQPSPKDQIFTVALPCAFYPCLMTAGSFLTASCSPTPLPVVSTGPSLFPVAQEIPTCRSYMPFTGSSQRPPTSPGEADTSPISLTFISWRIMGRLISVSLSRLYTSWA